MKVSKKQKFIIIIVLVVVVLITNKIKKENWNLSYLMAPESIRIDGQLIVEDGLVIIKPLELIKNFRGITLRAEVELDEELKHQGFYFRQFPNLALERNTQLNLEDWGTPHIRGTYPTSIKEKFYPGGQYLEYFYPFTELLYQEGDGLTLAFYRGYIEKELNEIYPIELNQKKYIKFNGLGEFEININKGAKVINSSSLIRSYNGYSMDVYYQVYSLLEDRKMLPRGGEGRGSGTREAMTYNHKYTVDPDFWEGDLQLQIHSISFTIEPKDLDQYPTLEILMGNPSIK